MVKHTFLIYFCTMNRLIKALWFTTLLALAAFLLFVYAGFREDQIIYISDGLSGVGKEIFFFLSLFGIVLVNFTLYTMNWQLRKRDNHYSEFMKGWLLGLAAGLNFFLIVVLSFVQVYNGGENFDYAYFGYLIFISLGVIIIISASLPIFMIRQKFSS